MHGLILAEFESFVVSSLGRKAWARVMGAGVGQRRYQRDTTYPDAEVAVLLGTAARVGRVSPSTLLERFGEYLAAPLLSLLPGSLPSEWRTLDVLAHVDAGIHSILRQSDPASNPPRLRCYAVYGSTAVIEYDSPRRLCALAIGVARGIAKHFSEELEIEQLRCMHRGADTCLLTFRVIGSPVRGAIESVKKTHSYVTQQVGTDSCTVLVAAPGALEAASHPDPEIVSPPG